MKSSNNMMKAVTRPIIVPKFILSSSEVRQVQRGIRLFYDWEFDTVLTAHVIGQADDI
jgi:hypothetical protein